MFFSFMKRNKASNFRDSSVRPARNNKFSSSFWKIIKLFRKPAGRVIKYPRKKTVMIDAVGSLNLSDKMTYERIKILGRTVSIKVSIFKAILLYPLFHPEVLGLLDQFFLVHNHL